MKIIPRDQDIRVEHIQPGLHIETMGGFLFLINREIDKKCYLSNNKSGNQTTVCVRQYELICNGCNTIKNVLATSMVLKNMVCKPCSRINKDKVKNTLKIGSIAKNQYLEEFKVLRLVGQHHVIERKDRKRLIKTFELECMQCNHTFETHHYNIKAKTLVCRKCKGLSTNINQIGVPEERRIEYMNEINKIWDDMKIMIKQDTINQYLSNKFGVKLDELEEEPIVYVETEPDDELNYFDDVDNDIKNMFDEYEN
jgi:L-rhamnose mutarotase